MHDFSRQEFRITYIWREDPGRMWHSRSMLPRALCKARLADAVRWWQLLRVKSLFGRLRRLVPEATYTVAGLGSFGTFPDWIEDVRVKKFDASTERKLCQTYSESRLVIGPHGSNMILPSAQAGMAVSLMPQKRWGCFAQDLLFSEYDDRMALFQKRIVPITVDLGDLADMCENMVHFRDGFIKRMVTPFENWVPASEGEL